MGRWQLALAVLVLPASWLLTGAIRTYTVNHGIMDVPNDRSSHRVKTPRGGGLAIALTFLPGTALLAALGILPPSFAFALCGGGAAIAWVGWRDDRKSVPPLLRLAVHVGAAIWAVAWLGVPRTLNLGSANVRLGPGGAFLGVFWIAWCVNLYNFMDGIDGLAGTEAVFVSLAGGFFLAWAGGDGLAAVCLLLASSCLGFLRWNWPPARIFLGDVGSGTLGYTFALLALASEQGRLVPLLVWLILLGVFVVDATATLLRRMASSARWFAPHRTHAYQYAVEAGLSHAAVTLAVMAVDLVLAAVAASYALWPRGILAVTAAVMVLLLCLQLRIAHVGAELARARVAETLTAATKSVRD